MNLEQLSKALPNLYPLLRLRSGRKIKTNEAEGTLSPNGLTVTVKTVFPPSALRRTELLVTIASGELLVSPLDPAQMADAQRFAELARNLWLETDDDIGPIRCVKVDAKCFFAVAKSAAAAKPNAPAGVSAQHATPAGKPSAQKGAS